MARKQIPTSLPPLAQVFEDFQAMVETDIKQQVLIDALRKVTKRFRVKKSRSFYTMRDVGAFFGVPLRTVAIAYERLEQEGLLTRIRGSQTLLTGKDVSSATPVRGVVGIPLWLHAIVVSPFSRLLHMELEDRLRTHGFVADIIFFREDEVTSPDFAERMLLHNLDIVIWHTPHPLATQTLLRLNDRGVKQLIVVPSDNPSSINLPTYVQEWQGAYRAFAEAWRAKGIQHVVVPNPIYLPSKRATKSFLSTLNKAGLEVEFVEGSAKTIREKVRARGAERTGVAFLDQVGAESICNEEPVIIEELLRISRLAYCRGRIRMPYFNHREGVADYVAFSPREIAIRLVDDIKNNLLSSGNPLHTFYGKFHEDVPFVDALDRL